MHWSLFRCLLVLPLLASGLTLTAQTRKAMPESLLPPDLNQITNRAATIFVGQVRKIEPIRVAASDEIGGVQISFHVEQGIRGARNGETFSFCEWAGLWTAGPRYRIGQRLMLFLYAPSGLGLTSPVDDRAGKFAVDRDGRIILSPGQSQAIRTSPKPIRLDLKRPIPLREFTRVVRRMREE
jgi:hypothetical protein